MTRSEEIIWLAALLDGEGSFMALKDSRGYRPCLRVKLEMVDLDIVQHATKIFYSKSTIRSFARFGRNCQTTFSYTWSGADAEKVMRGVLPYMGERRSAKIRECLKTPNLSHRKATA